MVHKIGNTMDLENIPITDSTALRYVRFYAEILTDSYGADRNIDTDNGGYILYATPDTDIEEIKSFFDFTQHIAEHAEICGNIYTAVYILSSDYGVVIVMSATDLPPEILNQINNKELTI